MKTYAGIDLHSSNNYIGVIDAKDKRLYSKRHDNRIEDILKVFAKFKASLQGVVIEFTYNWYWLVDGLMDQGYTVHLANPNAIKTYDGLKHTDDKWDSFWLAHMLRLGILPERIRPGQPQQNPRHERMHRTLKDDCCKPPSSSRIRQQAAFDDFRDDFNNHRPHESLKQHFPAECYVPSPRPYPLILPEMTYPDDMVVRAVKSQGDISWKNRHIYLTSVLAGEIVGLRQVNNHRWDIFFGPIRLAQLDTVSSKLVHLPRPKTRRRKKRQ